MRQILIRLAVIGTDDGTDVVHTRTRRGEDDVPSFMPLAMVHSMPQARPAATLVLPGTLAKKIGM